MILRMKSESHIEAAGELAAFLWPKHSPQEMQAEFAELITSGSDAVFLCYGEDMPVGFAHCSLRHDYVEGTSSSPVGYLEGIYVRPEDRGRGVASKLLEACEDWAKDMGCTEFASDCQLQNTDSLAFHLSVGFSEANRIIHFTKRLSYDE